MNKNVTVVTRYNADRIESEVKHPYGDLRHNFATKVLNLKEIGVIDALKKLGWTPPNENTKIKMTKELPAEAGEYYFASDAGGTPIIGEVYNGTFFYSDQQMAVNGMRGYWAKVDKDQFEFEGK